MLDLHVHVLPGIDDGPATLSDAVKLARAMVDEGVRHVVATPHVYPGVFDNTLETIAAAHAQLDAALAQQQVPLILSLGAEVRLCAEMLDWLAQGRLPFLGGQSGVDPVVLVELPDAQIPVGADRVLGALIDRGVTPLLAHPERNRVIAEQVSRLEPFIRLGCKLQLTAASLLGEFGSRAERAALELLDAGWVEVVASDAHNLKGRRPRLGAAREWLTQRYGLELAEALTEHNPARLAHQGELAMQAADGMTLRDLPRGHGEPGTQRSTARPSLIDSLADFPAGGAAAAQPSQAAQPTSPLRAGQQAAAPQAANPADTWRLMDFNLPGQGEAASASARPAEARPTASLDDWGDWALPFGQASTPSATEDAVTAEPNGLVGPTDLDDPAAWPTVPVALDDSAEPAPAPQPSDLPPLPPLPRIPLPRDLPTLEERLEGIEHDLASAPQPGHPLNTWPSSVMQAVPEMQELPDLPKLPELPVVPELPELPEQQPAEATLPSPQAAEEPAQVSSTAASAGSSRWNLLGWMRSRRAATALEEQPTPASPAVIEAEAPATAAAPSTTAAVAPAATEVWPDTVVEPVLRDLPQAAPRLPAPMKGRSLSAFEDIHPLPHAAAASADARHTTVPRRGAAVASSGSARFAPPPQRAGHDRPVGQAAAASAAPEQAPRHAHWPA